MRGLYAHASDRMRDDLKAALEARWEEALHARAALHPRSPVPLLDDLLTLFHAPPRNQAVVIAFRDTLRHAPVLGGREKMISQIPPKHAEGPTPKRGARPYMRSV